MNLTPYLIFDGRCEEAIQFYQHTLGAEVQMLMRFSQSPEPCADGSQPPADKVMHAAFRVGGNLVMASDGGGCSNAPEFKGFSLSLTLADAAEVHRRFGALAEGGTVTMPVAETFFSPAFGMLTDKFGVSWMVLVEAPPPQQP